MVWHMYHMCVIKCDRSSIKLSLTWPIFFFFLNFNSFDSYFTHLVGLVTATMSNINWIFILPTKGLHCPIIHRLEDVSVWDILIFISSFCSEYDRKVDNWYPKLQSENSILKVNYYSIITKWFIGDIIDHFHRPCSSPNMSAWNQKIKLLFAYDQKS